MHVSDRGLNHGALLYCRCEVKATELPDHSHSSILLFAHLVDFLLDVRCDKQATKCVMEAGHLCPNGPFGFLNHHDLKNFHMSILNIQTPTESIFPCFKQKERFTSA